MYKEIDTQFPGSKFILTMRQSPEVWFASLCKMAMRRGPLTRFEQYIYGYAIPHGHKDEHIDFYNAHNQAVEDYFRERPEQLLKVCWETGDGWEELANYLGKPVPDQPFPHINKTVPLMYAGNSELGARLFRLFYLSYQKVGKRVLPSSFVERLKRL
jgi:hypothetical protein